MKRKKTVSSYEEIKSIEKELEETEMCDVCGKNFNYKDIKRFQYINKRNIVYVIRCCPFCNIINILPRLI